MAKSVFLLLVLSVIVGSWPTSFAQEKEQNQSVRHLDRFPTQLDVLSKSDHMELRTALSRYRGLRTSGGEKDHYYPAFLWPWRDSHILIEWPKNIVTPGIADLRVQLLSKDECVGAFEISLGWRKHPGWTTVRELAAPQNPLLEVSLTGYGNWDGHDYEDIAREYFSISREGIKLVRLENLFGELIRNRYYYPNYTIGGFSKPRSEDEVLRIIDSQDKCDVLETLIWIGGIHAKTSMIQSHERQKIKVQMESLEEANLVNSIRANTKVIAILEKLTQSSDRWIREAAHKALSRENDEE